MDRGGGKSGRLRKGFLGKKKKARMSFFSYAAEMFEIYSVCHQLLRNTFSHVTKCF